MALINLINGAVGSHSPVSKALGDGLASNLNNDEEGERTTTQIEVDDGCANVERYL